MQVQGVQGSEELGEGMVIKRQGLIVVVRRQGNQSMTRGQGKTTITLYTALVQPSSVQGVAFDPIIPLV